MQKLLKNVLMAAVIGFGVGVAIALLAPTIGAIAGVAPGGMGNPLFMGMFAGSWGALGAIVTPAITYAATALFDKKSSSSHDIAASLPAQTITNGRAEGLDLEAEEAPTHFRDRLLAERAQQTGRIVH